jgi:hypothetical protein
MRRHTGGKNRKLSWKGGKGLKMGSYCMGCMGPRQHQNWYRERVEEAAQGNREKHGQHKRGC